MKIWLGVRFTLEITESDSQRKTSEIKVLFCGNAIVVNYFYEYLTRDVRFMNKTNIKSGIK